MFCPKCGDPVEANEIFCNKCGNQLRASPYMQNQTPNGNKSSKKMILVGIAAGLCFVAIVFICTLVFGKKDYYFSEESHEEITENINQNNEVISSNDNNTQKKKKGKYQTVIIADNKYDGVSISGTDDAYELISEDSVKQKVNCPEEIKSIENEIIKKYGVTAVNLCEVDTGFATEISKVFEKIYTEYPSVRSYLTNLTLVNGSISDSYIAAFQPLFDFAYSGTLSTYPWVMKTQILLNTTYFLNQAKLEASVRDGSNTGHFPPNATMYSPVAHELGHYLSFIAMMKHHDVDSVLLIDKANFNDYQDVYQDFIDGKFSLSMIKEAYENYKKVTNTTLALDEWRATISNYAVAKDNAGNYIYDETIAESFHDLYLNGDNAKDASKYIIAVLKEKLEG